jgi:molybdate transport system substrate-binding protein
MAAAAVLVAAIVGLGACREVKVTPPSSSTMSVRVTGSITVSAASSLTDVFTAIGERFMRDNPGTTVTFNFGSSTALATQIRNGAPVDTFAAADLATMERLGADGFVGSPTSIAANRLVIVTKPGDTHVVRSLADLPDAGIVALCAAEAPCGMYAGQVLARAGVMIPESSITRGVDARATIGAVTRGDADAAVVYATDARAAGDAVVTVPIPQAQNVRAIYQMASVRRAGEPTVSSAFIAYTLSPAGRAILRRAGFITAP